MTPEQIEEAKDDYLTARLREKGGITCLSAAAKIDALSARLAEVEAVMRTVISRAQDAKRRYNGGDPVDAFVLASGILGQIGDDVARLSPTDAQEGQE